MKRLGKAVVLTCTLAVIMGLSLPASSQARDSRKGHDGKRSERSCDRRDRRDHGHYGHRGRDCYRPYRYPRRPVRPWGGPIWGSFCFWTPSWGFGGRF